jgi:hypothetical protein
MGTEYEKYAIASGIATSVFIYSFSAGEKKGTTLPRIRLSLLREGIPYTIVGDTVSELEKQLWYFHSLNQNYSFKLQPNLNKVIIDKEEGVSGHKVRDEIDNYIKDHAGRDLNVFLYPKESVDIPDDKRLKLAIIDPDLSYDSDKTKLFSNELFQKSGISFRIYKNNLFVLAADDNQIGSFTKAIRRLIALKDVQADDELIKSITKEANIELKRKLKETEDNIHFFLLSAYRHLAISESKGVTWKDLGLPTTGVDQSLSQRVKQFLIDQEKLLDKVSAQYIVDKFMGKDESEKPAKEIFEQSMKTPGMPIFEDQQVILNAITAGTKGGAIGTRESGEIRFQEEILPTIDSVIVRGEIAKDIKSKMESKTEETPSKPITPEPKKKAAEGAITKLKVKASIPWDKMSALLTGVIRPLKDKGFPPEIIVEIKGTSEEGFDRTTLDTKVKETLRQIGAQIEIWEEE